MRVPYWLDAYLAEEKASQAATGGEVRQVPTAAIAPIQHTPDEPRPPQPQLQPPHVKALPAIAEKRPKSHSSTKEPSKPPAPPAKPASQPFENIFGTPIKAKSSPDPSVKNKDTSISNHQKPQKTLQPPPPQPVIAPVKEAKIAPVKETKITPKEPETKEPKVKPPKIEKEQKAGTKRPLTPEVANHHSNSSVSTPTLEKKRKHATSSGGAGKKTSDSNSNKTEKTKEKKEKVKSKSSSSSSSSSSLTSKKDKHKSSSHSKSANANTSHKLPSSPPDVFSQSQNADSNGTKPFLKSEDSSSNTPHSSAPVLSPVEKSLSPPTQELDNDFLTVSSDEDNIILPARSKEKLQNSSTGGGSSNHHSDDFENSSSNHAFPDRPSSRASGKSNSSVKPKKSPTKNHKTNAKHSNSSSPAAVMKENHVNSPSSSAADSPKSPKPPAKTLDSDYHQELVDLQKKIMAINDQHQLQKIVDVIEKTGKFSITTSSFDFDLCSLDIGTVRQLKNCLSM